MGKTGEKALLQGWAVIDNTSGEDWSNVSLSLSSGAPISFIYDLHRPNFIQRRQLGVVASGAVAPVAQAAVASPAMAGLATAAWATGATAPLATTPSCRR